MLMEILDELKDSKTTLVAVSKTKPNKAILDLYEQGQRIFGENRVQELVDKHSNLPKDIQWHLIGHLQKNKVKYIASFVTMIHSIDSISLLEMVNNKAIHNDRKIEVLLQLKIAKEETKYGFEINNLLENLDPSKYSNILFKGVMGMATFTDNESQIRKEFQTLLSFKNQLKDQLFASNADFKEVSMGMSGDYKIAIQEGSTMVRIGSLLFGKRE